jgi:hypothetical protein
MSIGGVFESFMHPEERYYAIEYGSNYEVRQYIFSKF